MLASIIKKIKIGYLRKVNQEKLVRFLEIDCADPASVRIFGRPDFGSESWILTFGKNVYITDGVKFITHDGGTLLFRDRIPDLEITKPIVLGDNVYIGNNAIILPGVIIGSNVIIGAGSIVTKNVPSGEVWAGVPAKRIKDIDSYREKLERESLHLGQYAGKEKDVRLREYYCRAKR